MPVFLSQAVDGKPPDGPEAKARNGELELLPDQTNDVDGVDVLINSHQL